MQPLVVDHATIPQMKAMDVPFHLVYGSLICVKGLQSDRPKCWASLVDPREYQNMIIKYLSVGLQSWFTYQQVAWNTLFQMRYDSLPNSEKQPCDSQRGWSNSCFHISLILFLLPASKTCLSNLVSHSVTSWSRWGYHISFERGDLEHYGVQKFWNFLIDRYKLSLVQITQFLMGLESSGVYQQSFTFWSVTLQPLGAYRSTIPHMKGDIHSFHMRYGSLLLTKWLHRYGHCNPLIRPTL